MMFVCTCFSPENKINFTSNSIPTDVSSMPSIEVDGFSCVDSISSYFLSRLSLISLLNSWCDFIASMSWANDSNFI